jgi:hypothetical protein
METKICSKCKQEKTISKFDKDRHSSLGIRSDCKTCRSKTKKELYIKNKDKILKNRKIYRDKNKKHINKKTRMKRKEIPWRFTLYEIKKRCNNSNNVRYYRYGGRGIKCLITEEELKELWFRDKAYNMKKPSIDRINNDGNYEYNNCQYIEYYINGEKDKKKPIIQLNKNGDFIKEWDSITEASNSLGIQLGDISVCANKGYKGKWQLKSAGGFKWEFKEKDNA